MASILLTTNIFILDIISSLWWAAITGIIPGHPVLQDPRHHSQIKMYSLALIIPIIMTIYSDLIDGNKNFFKLRSNSNMASNDTYRCHD